MSKIKDKERILKTAIEKIITYKETSLAISRKLTSWEGVGYFQRAKRKKNVDQEYSIQQSYPSEMKDKDFSNKI